MNCMYSAHIPRLHYWSIHQMHMRLAHKTSRGGLFKVLEKNSSAVACGCPIAIRVPLALPNERSRPRRAIHLQGAQNAIIQLQMVDIEMK